MADRKELGALLNRLGLVGSSVEVGVFKGEFARELLEEWKGRELILVDPWTHLSNYLDSWNLSSPQMEQNYQMTLRNLSGFSDRIRILRMTSEEAAPLVQDESCDLVYIDANHAYQSVKRDLALWFPKLRKGGVMAGHDYFDALADQDLEPIRGGPEALPKENLTSYGVKSAVDEFAACLNARLFVTPERDPTWFFIR